MEPTNQGGIVQAESESEELEGEIGEDEAEAEKEEEVEEADRHQLLLELNLHLSCYKITKSHSHSKFSIKFQSTIISLVHKDTAVFQVALTMYSSGALIIRDAIKLYGGQPQTPARDRSLTNYSTLIFQTPAYSICYTLFFAGDGQVQAFSLLFMR